MTESQIIIGSSVKSNVNFAGIPKGTRGVIDEDYGSGIIVAWDYPTGILPVGYKQYDGKWAIETGIVRDGFNKKDELHYLDFIEDVEFIEVSQFVPVAQLDRAIDF